jgi:hypothetical protein
MRGLKRHYPEIMKSQDARDGLKSAIEISYQHSGKSDKAP